MENSAQGPNRVPLLRTLGEPYLEFWIPRALAMERTGLACFINVFFTEVAQRKQALPFRLQVQDKYLSKLKL